MPKDPFAYQAPVRGRLPSTVTGWFLRTERGRRLATRLFHRAYYAVEETWQDSSWLGVNAQKTPQDLWVYQEILVETRPDVIVETGTLHGGSALYLATVCDALDHGRVISIDLQALNDLPEHPRIEYVAGSSTSDEVIEEVRSRIADSDRVMVLLDSDHTRDHVLAELHLYGALVTDACYLVVEDTNLNGRPVRQDWGPGPMAALEEYLAAGAPFTVDRSREKFLFSFNPRGFLKRGSA